MTSTLPKPVPDPWEPSQGGSPLARRDERRLLDALADGDRRAAETLVERTYARIYRALVKMTGGDVDLAADLTQETYRRAWKALGSFDRRARLATWLHRIAYTTFLNHVRRPRLFEPLDDAGPEPPAPAPPAEEVLAEKGEASRLRRAVLELPEQLRFTVTARYWSDLSVREIAQIENVTGAAIRKRLKKAMQMLELALDQEDIR